MSTSPNTPSFTGLSVRPAGQARSAWLREPLLHFLVLGALLFAADHVLVGRSDDPRSIVVGAAVDAEAKQVFTAARGREPNAEELKALRQVWLDNEVLYREGLALQVDRGDTAIRERVIFKALSVVDANTKLPAVDDKVLRDWFEKNRAKYDEPARFDFQEAALSGDNSEAAARAFVTELNAGTPGDAKAGLRVFKGRPHGNIVQSYGAEFAQALEALPPGEWRALPTREGWRAMRLEAISPAKPANFETLRGVLLPDWTDATMAEQRSAAVRALTQKYKVKYEASKP
ncbi:peptidylprolyl isomerase [Roseateles oligotrophus]|uniref:Peptidyl-prolyl cis-trans isomerase n=1 Tax=Roseateles oligotrophus TaxID=1769250 RepID=A0ABT2YJY6_9BURK|nr:peptidylprolyl isomerase [Roseateles oligotrophus]MCV2370361.1 peptidyl-prolyl cis-trans isomerase [Roseateles oligotrophus]